MGTVNFSIPDEVKDSFNEAFAGQNKSAVIAELMREAVERVEARRRSGAAIGRILRRRDTAPARTDAALRRARAAGRP